MARHLYALMMLFADQGAYNWSVETGLTATQQQQLTARRIAQWAINAVSFRDATSMMTPFMYHWDIYQSTYNGWTVDGDPGNQSQAGNGNYGIVWACKPPDALLTETIAFHDKRIADTAWDSGNSHKIGDKPADSGGTSGTPNFDQVRIPQGSTFIEIYCTHNGNLPYAPVDLYTLYNPAAAWSATSNPWCLNLSKMAPDGNPVWRLAISKSRLSNPNADFLTATSPNSLALHPDTTTFEPTTDPAAAGMPWQKMNLFDTTGTKTCPSSVSYGSAVRFRSLLRRRPFHPAGSPRRVRRFITTAPATLTWRRAVTRSLARGPRPTSARPATLRRAPPPYRNGERLRCRRSRSRRRESPLPVRAAHRRCRRRTSRNRSRSRRSAWSAPPIHLRRGTAPPLSPLRRPRASA